MDIYQEETYGECIAVIYDEWYFEFDETMFNVLADLAKGGRVLELGIGTGRVAMPLHKRGIEVHGIDVSKAMVDRLSAKTGRNFAASADILRA